MSKRSIKPEWTSGAHNIFWKEFKFLFNYKCNLLRSCYNISSDSKPRSACVKQAYSRVSEQGPLFYSLPFPEIDHIPKYRVYWIVSCGLQSFFFHHFVRLTIEGGLHFFLLLIERCSWRSAFSCPGFVKQTPFRIVFPFFSITCTRACWVSWGIMMNRSQMQWSSNITSVANQTLIMLYTKVSHRFK